MEKSLIKNKKIIELEEKIKYMIFYIITNGF